jgi:site-specific recombinase XerD
MPQPKSITMDIQDFLQRFAERLKIQRYSPSSIKNYQNNLLLFFNYISKQFSCIEEIEISHIENYLFWKKNNGNCSISHQKMILVSITKFYDFVLGIKINLNHLYPKRTEINPPNFLTFEEVKRLIEITENLKHKCLIMFLYSAGLRLCEVINLKKKDIDLINRTIFIRQVKDRKDRKVMLSENLVHYLTQYYLKYKPVYYVFEGQNRSQFSGRSVQQIVKQNAIKSGLYKKVSPHILRHSFAVHLLESGVDIRCIQELLGHHQLETTEVYTQLIDLARYRIKSPLDRM